jgi:hypothetical protein
LPARTRPRLIPATASKRVSCAKRCRQACGREPGASAERFHRDRRRSPVQRKRDEFLASRPIGKPRRSGAFP